MFDWRFVCILFVFVFFYLNIGFGVKWIFRRGGEGKVEEEEGDIKRG